ncbi:hypothetical protein OBBRIDRAFT_806969 [Obba rivulosa]|uniref:Uncharacterized protein n=1 Tax=Obba rivulosa TaxID=1052685 RepID=A0A8E2AQK4_9APHY|nr:hypothetical protein OBBRIDRAFT_806969 [Obba rivulosa]
MGKLHRTHVSMCEVWSFQIFTYDTGLRGRTTIATGNKAEQVDGRILRDGWCAQQFSDERPRHFAFENPVGTSTPTYGDAENACFEAIPRHASPVRDACSGPRVTAYCAIRGPLRVRGLNRPETARNGVHVRRFREFAGEAASAAMPAGQDLFVNKRNTLQKNQRTLGHLGSELQRADKANWQILTREFNEIPATSLFSGHRTAECLILRLRAQSPPWAVTVRQPSVLNQACQRPARIQKNDIQARCNLLPIRTCLYMGTCHATWPLDLAVQALPCPCTLDGIQLSNHFTGADRRSSPFTVTSARTCPCQLEAQVRMRKPEIPQVETQFPWLRAAETRFPYTSSISIAGDHCRVSAVFPEIDSLRQKSIVSTLPAVCWDFQRGHPEAVHVGAERLDSGYSTEVLSTAPSLYVSPHGAVELISTAQQDIYFVRTSQLYKKALPLSGLSVFLVFTIDQRDASWLVGHSG